MANHSEIKFGTDGWRGIIAWDFTFQNVRIAAQAIADIIREDHPRPEDAAKFNVFVTYDRRFNSDLFAQNIAQILRANKIGTVISETPLPTPAASLMTKEKFGMAIMVTASHNPFQYNGIKIKVEGRSAPDALTNSIERMLGHTAPIMLHTLPLTAKDEMPAYLSYVKSKFDVKKLAANMKHPVVIDYMYGSAAGIIETLIPSKKLTAIRTVHDPLFGGINPEPVESNLAELKKAVKENKAAAGIALDGDGDRVGIIDDRGAYLTPCQIYPIIVDYLVNRQKKKGKILQSVSMGYLAKRIAKENGLAYEEAPVGFKYIAEKILAEDVLAGAEESGGYAWKGTLPDRDGVMTALLLIQIMQETGKSLSELIADIEKKYGKSVFLRKDLKLKSPIPDKKSFAEKMIKKLPKKVNGAPITETPATDGLKILLGNGNWMLIRPSGTEPVMRIYAESPALKETEALLDFAEKLVAKQIQ
ncbi:MAG: hypothetical protein WCS77_02690 [Elusimicrobiaceae bacterium]